MQQKIQHYLDYERTEVLKNHCHTLSRQIIDTAEEMYRLVKQRYPEDPEQAQRLQQDQRNVRWSEWWGTK